jgi:phosphonate transport system substrate-binding protein
MILRRSLLAFGAVAALALAGCGEKAATGAAQDTITFSILSTESAQNMESYWTPILADMEKQTGLKVKPFFSGSYSALIEAMRFKQSTWAGSPTSRVWRPCARRRRGLRPHDRSVRHRRLQAR